MHQATEARIAAPWREGDACHFMQKLKDEPDPMTRRSDPAANPRAHGFKGNKASLPSKPCAVCGRPMTWRRAWAKNWDEVRHCSDACRRGTPRGR